MPAKYQTERAFAKAVGISQSALRKTLRLDDCPVSAKGPWTMRDLRLLNAYRKHLQPDRAAEFNEQVKAAADGQVEPEGMSPARIVDLKLKTERLLLIRRQREILEGRYALVEDCVDVVRKLAGITIGRIAALPAKVSPTLEGLTAGEIMDALEKEIFDLRTILADETRYRPELSQ